RCMIFAHLAVDARRLAVANAGDPEIERLRDAPRQDDIVRRYRATFAGGECLGGVKAYRNRDLAEIVARMLGEPGKTRGAIDGNRDPSRRAKTYPRRLRHRTAEWRHRHDQTYTAAVMMIDQRVGGEHPARAIDIGKMGSVAALLDCGGC